MTKHKKNTPGMSQWTVGRVFTALGSLKLTVVCLSLLAVLVIWGTVYQAENGLYAAQQKFFHSWIFFVLGFIPFPGTVAVMFVLFVNLVFSIFYRIGFRLSRIGNLIGHAGILILLAGGGFTMYFAEESVLQLREGEASQHAVSRYGWELSVWETSGGRNTGYRVSAEGFKTGMDLPMPRFPFQLTVKEFYPHCEAFTSGNRVEKGAPLNGSGIRELRAAPPPDDGGESTAGLILELPGADAPEVLLFGHDDKPARLSLKGRIYSFELARQRVPLPLEVSLKDFRVVCYPNSTIPKSFESHVLIRGEGESGREAVISMNRPLRFRDYTLFQSSYFLDEGGHENTVLAVVKNSGRLLPYIASITIFMGLLIQFLMKLFRRRETEGGEKAGATVSSGSGAAAAVGLFLLMVFWAGATGMEAQTAPPSSGALKRLIVLENGRKKPLDTFARNILKQISGTDSYEKQSAAEWLGRVMFAPQEAERDKIFLVANPEVLDSMGAPATGKARDRYSFAHLKAGLPLLRRGAMKVSEMKPEQRSPVDNEIYGLYQKMYLFQQLQATFDFVRPHPDFRVHDGGVNTLLGIAPGKKTLSFLDAALHWDQIRRAAAGFSETDAAERTPFQRDIEQLQKRAMAWTSMYHDLPVAIVPSVEKKEGTQEKWVSPWDVVFSLLTAPQKDSREYANLFRQMAESYESGDNKGFEAAVTTLEGMILKKAGRSADSGKIRAELWYNWMDPFYKCKFFYGFSLLFLLASMIGFKKWFYRASLALLGLGALLHAAGVILRIYIMSRPPVTNLYETFVFTGLTTALLGLILEWAKKRNIGIAAGAPAAFILLMIAGKYALDGDTMGMLAAVLDSNFWLAFHVMTIILGYAGVLLSGFLGHVYIVQRIAFPTREDLLRNTFQALYATQAFGLLFTFLGTVLGGIWADQSWGRFWGWDPKENGALLILLWSAILFHARLAGWMRETGMAFGSIAGVIAVALAWFGVNLLGVGLHSYGFTSGVAHLLFGFIVLEILFMAVCGVILPNRKAARAPGN